MPSMTFDDLDEWDSTFLEQAVYLEEKIISDSNFFTQSHHSNFSPPRELSLSQNPTQFPPPLLLDASVQEQQESELDILKRELRRVSQDLAHSEKECAELKKDREEKEQQLRSFAHTNAAPIEQGIIHQERIQIPRFQNASTSTPPVPFSGFEDVDNRRILCASDAPNALDRLESNSSNHQPCRSYALKGKNVQLDGVPATIECKRNISVDSAAVNSNESSIPNLLLPATTAQPKYTKAVGIQTDTDDGYAHLTGNCDLLSQHDLLTKFLAIWGLPSRHRTGRSLVSKLFTMCATDFYALFRCMGMSMPSATESLSDACLPALALHDKSQHIKSLEAAKVAHLYFILTKTNSEMLQLDAIFDVLIDLCTINNAVVVRSSLRILCVILHNVPGWNAKSVERDNVMVEGMHPRNNTEIRKSRVVDTGGRFCVMRKWTPSLGNDSSNIGSFDMDILCNKEHGDPSHMAFAASFDWLMLFETIHHIAAASKEESIQVEAVSVMNMILMRSDPCSEREKFGSSPLFENLSRLLQKDVGLQVRREALHLLFLLLNCPKILVMFCCGSQDCASHEAAADSTQDTLTFQSCSAILEGVAECVKCRGRGTEELKLRRLSIKVLAFVASSSKSGFEVLVNPKISKGVSFLELIMQALALEMDGEAAESTEMTETSKERTWFIREALILMNRIASSPAYSSAVFQVLTSRRDTLTLTIQFVNKMSGKGTEWWKCDGSKKRKAEDEIVDLARAFRSRVFGYLGNTLS